MLNRERRALLEASAEVGVDEFIRLTKDNARKTETIKAITEALRGIEGPTVVEQLILSILQNLEEK